MAEVTRERVFEIAAALEAQGKRATHSAVRDVMGGGSFTTIGKLMKEYAEHKEQVQHQQNMDIPAELEELSRASLAGVWEMAKKIADTENAALKESVKLLTQEMQGLNEDHQSNLEALENEHSAAIEALKAEHKSAIEDMSGDLEDARTLNEASDKAIAEQEKVIERLQIENARLNGELASMGKVQEMIQAAMKDKT